MKIDQTIQAHDLAENLKRMWRLSATKILAIEESCQHDQGAPVFTAQGKYQSQGWTEWTQGFQFGAAVLQFDATGDEQFLALGRRNTIERMPSHVTHIGVHDHGFNNVSTYGNLRRLMLEGRIPHDDRELQLYELALKTSAAIQAARFSSTYDGDGYIYSFNGPHSLFCDTIRSLRSLAVGYHLGHCLMAENDQRINLLDRLLQHARVTAEYNVYYGQNRDVYDVRGRVAHESVFNRNDGRYRCASTQQGYSPFSTWTRGLAWIMLGYSEQLEFLQALDDGELEPFGGHDANYAIMLEAASATCDFYIDNTPSDGIPYWDTGAPGLSRMGDYLSRPADLFNDFEPVDSSAAAIAAQGLLRFGRFLESSGSAADGRRYWQAGLTVLRTLLDESYISTDPDHEGLLLHTVYHRPRGWDHVPAGDAIPHSESCMWGDYHLREVGLYVQRIADQQPYYSFFGPAL